MKTLLTLILIFIVQLGFAQTFNTYNYNTQNSDVLWDVIGYDSGYLLTGYSQDSALSVTSNIYAEPVLIKLSKDGNPIDTLISSSFGNTELNLLSVYNGGYIFTFGVTNPPNDSFRLFVTKYDTLFNLVQRKEYLQLQGMYFRQLRKTKEMTDSSLYLIGYYHKTYPIYDKSFIINYNFNTMEFDLYKEFPVSCIITDALVDDTSYFCTMAIYNSNPWISVAVRYDTALNTLSTDTLVALGIAENNNMQSYFTISHYKDSLYLCTGHAWITDSVNWNDDYASLIVQTFNPKFEVISQKYWYYDSVVELEPSYYNSFVANNNNEYFIGTTLNLNMLFPNQGIMIVKVDSNLNTIWQKHIVCKTATMRLMNMLPTDDGGVLALYWEQISLAGAQLMNTKLIKIGSNGEVSTIYESKNTMTNSMVNLYPNPASKQITLEVQQSSKRIVTYSLYNVQGKLLKSKQFNSRQVQIDIEQLSKGVYFIQGRMMDGTKFSQKFIKE